VPEPGLGFIWYLAVRSRLRTHDFGMPVVTLSGLRFAVPCFYKVFRNSVCGDKFPALSLEAADLTQAIKMQRE